MAVTEICEVLDVKKLSSRLFSMDIKTGDMAKLALPGQFVHIKCGDGSLLRRPISISNAVVRKEILATGEEQAAGGVITLVFEAKGDGTKWLSERRAGDKLDVIGTLGRGFDIKKAGERPIFIGGGIGVPPLFMGASHIVGKKADAILGFKNKEAVILEDEFKQVCGKVDICTDDGSYSGKGFVSDILKENLLMKKYTAIYACGPRPMLRAIAAIAKEHDIFCQVSMEERMGCGVGACLVCACKVHSNDADFDLKHVCKDGPVFDAEEVIL